MMYLYPTTLRDQQAGIELKSKRGTVAQTEWGKRWERMFTHATDQARLSRGRSNARKGRVLSVNVQGLHIKAEVSGNEYKPYIVTIDMLNPYSTAQWNDYIRHFSDKSYYLAHFLAGVMPSDSDMLFDSETNPLVHSSLESGCLVSCNCYDWDPYCKHVLAVLYILTEMIDENPLLLFQLRGRAIEDIIKTIRLIREHHVVEQLSPPKKLEQFWQQEQDLDLPPVPSTVPRGAGCTLLGKISWRVENKKIKTILTPLYTHLKKTARILRNAPKKALSE